MSDVAGRLSTEPLRFVWPRDTRKRLVSAFNISVHTARDWLRDGIPAARRRDMARVINAELDRIEADIRRIRQEGGR